MSFRTTRIILWLALLAFVGGMTYWESMALRSWLRPLVVDIYPINGDSSEKSQEYIAGLTVDQFQEIASFIEKQSEHYRLKKLPAVRIQLRPELTELPPSPQSGGLNALDAIMWSLQLRYYTFRHTPFWDSLGRIRLFVIYHEGTTGKPLQHSLGLHKGLVGVVHVFAQPAQASQNNVVITHELFHALGASDKYDANNMPIFPEGFGNPEEPRYPQQVAEIMGGRIAKSPDRAIIPAGLDDCVVGYKTAWEINW